MKLSTRPEKRVGSDEAWDHAEGIMQDVLKQIEAQGDNRIKTAINPGEGAFYGPKFEYVLRDAIGRDWQCGTTQVDFNLPERFERLLHRRRRLEEDAGDDPPRDLRLDGALPRHPARELRRPPAAVARRRCRRWSPPSPRTPTTMPREVPAAAQRAGLRAELDLRNEKINYKVREHSLAKVPVLLVVGKKEADRAHRSRSAGSARRASR